MKSEFELHSYVKKALLYNHNLIRLLYICSVETLPNPTLRNTGLLTYDLCKQQLKVQPNRMANQRNLIQQELYLDNPALVALQLRIKKKIKTPTVALIAPRCKVDYLAHEAEVVVDPDEEVHP
jgi:hypothetical protein